MLGHPSWDELVGEFKGFSRGWGSHFEGWLDPGKTTTMKSKASKKRRKRKKKKKEKKRNMGGEQSPGSQQIFLFSSIVLWQLASEKFPISKLQRIWKYLLGSPYFRDKAIKEIKLESTFDRLASFFISEALIPLLLATFPIWQIHTLFWNWRDEARNLQRKEGGGAPQAQSLPVALNISSRTVSSSQERRDWAERYDLFHQLAISKVPAYISRLQEWSHPPILPWFL